MRVGPIFRNPQSAIRNCAIVCLLAAAVALAAKEEPPLPDGYLLTGADGEFQQTAPGLYTFMFDKGIKTSKGSVVAGHEVELLPSTTLEYMLRDKGARPHMGVRLWGTVTVYRGRNYIFPSYYLQVAEAQTGKAGEPNAPAKPEEAAPGIPMPKINDSNDEIKIPEELMKELKATRRVVDVAPAPATSADANQPSPAAPIETGDAVIVDRMGIMVQPVANEWAFRLDGLGRNVSQINFHILPCQVLSQMEGERKPSAWTPLRYKMAGVVTRFKGEYYILPNGVVRAYNYGNFAQ